jgi:stage II sporulation protein AA (anti-sigma F factor antagonist)
MIKNTCDILCEPAADRLIITVSGEIDHHGAVYLRQKADEAIRAYVPQRLVLDMSGVSFMDSSGLGFIMGRFALMRELGGSTLVRDPAPCVERVLKLTGFDKRVKIIKNQKTEKEYEHQRI